MSKNYLLLLFFVSWSQAIALPQYQRLLKQEYGFKAPCATCHSQGGGSALSTYGKAFERAGKSRLALSTVATQVPKGDAFDFGTKLRAKANPNDPKSTPSNPGEWAGKNDIPTEELRSFSPPEVDSFSVLEGELKADQVTKLKVKLGEAFAEEDKFPVFYFGEVKGKKTYVVQYVTIPSLKKTLGFVVSTKGEVVNVSFVGAKKEPVSESLKSQVSGKKTEGIETLVKLSQGDDKQILIGILRGLSSIQLVFGSVK